jgi:L-amino acid N-acyltransferase YncA
MKIRRFNEADTPSLIELFRNTVHTVCKGTYSREQLDVWAPEHIDEKIWTTRFEKSFTVIAEKNGDIVGFANLEDHGYIDMFYVSASHQNEGVGKLIYQALESEALKQKIQSLLSDVSLTAQNFFNARGFTVEKEYLKVVANVTFPNAIMKKSLAKK